jgi:hypothetical protein
MGSSDPLTAGFEIRFGSLNFQATGNGYLMRITNRDELHPWRSTGQDRSPSRPVPTPRRPPKRTPQASQHRDADDAPSSALDRRGWNDAGPRMSPRIATRPSMRRQPHPRGSARFLSRGPPTACATLRWRTPRPPAPTWRRVRRPSRPPPPGGQEPYRHHQRRVLPRLHQRAATCHFAWVRRVGVLRRAGSSDVPAVPRRRGVLVRLL